MPTAYRIHVSLRLHWAEYAEADSSASIEAVVYNCLKANEEGISAQAEWHRAEKDELGIRGTTLSHVSYASTLQDYFRNLSQRVSRRVKFRHQAANHCHFWLCEWPQLQNGLTRCARVPSFRVSLPALSWVCSQEQT
jgi:hypothetical protein